MVQRMNRKRILGLREKERMMLGSYQKIIREIKMNSKVQAGKT